MRGPSIWPSGLLLSLLLFLITHTAAGPGQVHPPLCPYGSELAGRGRVFLRCWYDYQDIKKYSGSYRAFTKGQMWDNLTVTDITPNYPAPEGHGKFLSPFGEYAENRFQFSDLHEKYIPKFDKTFDFTHDVNAPSYGYRDENDCLTYHWESHYLATLLKPYGGKPTGAKVSWTHTHSFKTRHPFPNDDNGFNYLIQNATVKMDWSGWYT